MYVCVCVCVCVCADEWILCVCGYIENAQVRVNGPMQHVWIHKARGSVWIVDVRECVVEGCVWMRV